MKRYILGVMLVAIVTVYGMKSAQAQLLIDDFSTGRVRINLRSGESTRIQTGTMVGGSRHTSLFVPDAGGHNPYRQLGSLEISRGGPLVVSLGFKVGQRAEVVYGLGHPLDLNLLASNACGSTPCGRFRVHFDGSDAGLNFNMQVRTEGGSYSQAGYNLPANYAPFVVDFPFADFLVGGASFNDIDSIVLILQSDSFIGSNDYAITLVEAAP